jgi:hypothetical protein
MAVSLKNKAIFDGKDVFKSVKHNIKDLNIQYYSIG